MRWKGPRASLPSLSFVPRSTSACGGAQPAQKVVPRAMKAVGWPAGNQSWPSMRSEVSPWRGPGWRRILPPGSPTLPESTAHSRSRSRSSRHARVGGGRGAARTAIRQEARA
eukprot:scaffold45453_cov32-Tisochrysis_lutea.AAC.1